MAWCLRVLNAQPVEKRVSTANIEVVDMFYTIQGEGPFAGRPAVFIRLAGCNLQCPFCDTDYTSNRRSIPPRTIADEAVLAYRAPGTPLIVITGGEPMRQEAIGSLFRFLLARHCTVQVETNGTLAPPDVSPILLSNIYFVCSPKTGSVNPRLKPYIKAYKYVVEAGAVCESDGLPTQALGHPASPMLARPDPGVPLDRLYVQPMDPDPEGLNLKACLDSAFKFGYSLCIQQHKIIGVP